MAMSRGLRSAFRPEALSAFDKIFDEAWKELLADRVFPSSVLDTDETRTRLAQKVLTFASSGWTDNQIKQLVLRAFRNEAARRQRMKRPQLALVDTRPLSLASFQESERTQVTADQVVLELTKLATPAALRGRVCWI
jgi:hypothetical protein